MLRESGIFRMFVKPKVVRVEVPQNGIKKNNISQSKKSSAALKTYKNFMTPDTSLIKKAGETDIKWTTPEWREMMLIVAATYGEAGRELAIALSLNNTGWDDSIE